MRAVPGPTIRHFGIIGGKGAPRALRQHIGELRRAYEHTERVQDQEALQQRIGKLMGGTATLRVGGATEMEVKSRVTLAKRTAATMRAAMREGILPGGGTALLACRPALRAKLDESASVDEQAAYRILLRAVEEPFRTIVSNAGHDDRDVMAQVRLAGAGYGFDVNSGRITDILDAGIYDAARVLKAAAYGALTTAALALTVDVLVHHGEPEQAALPQPAKRKEL